MIQIRQSSADCPRPRLRLKLYIKYQLPEFLRDSSYGFSDTNRTLCIRVTPIENLVPSFLIRPAVMLPAVIKFLAIINILFLLCNIKTSSKLLPLYSSKNLFWTQIPTQEHLINASQYKQPIGRFCRQQTLQSQSRMPVSTWISL
jgi:hypothetical protein